MRRLLKIINYAAQLMALIDIGKAIKRWAAKTNDMRYPLDRCVFLEKSFGHTDYFV